MTISQVPLKFYPESSWVSLRKLCGHDEQSVDGTGTLDAILLIDRLLVDVSTNNIPPGQARLLTAADRDVLLAEIYISTYGPRIESTLSCTHCEVLFDIDFAVDELIHHQQGQVPDARIEKEPGGTFLLDDGTRFRLPTGEDECAVLGLSDEEAEQALLERCLIEGDPNNGAESVLQAMKVLAPLVALDVAAGCPECNQKQTVHFDIQNYLLTAIRQEQKQLAVEVHRLAGAYGWSLNEILGLPRQMRQTYVALVQNEPESSRRRIA